MYLARSICHIFKTATVAKIAAAAISLTLIGSVSATAAGPGGPNDGKWTGPTIGLYGGYAWADQDYPGVPDYPVGPPRANLSGGIAGLSIGYNTHLGGIVVGGVADIGFAKLNETVRDGNYLTHTTTIDRLTTVRAIVGLPMASFLPYVTAGYGWLSANYESVCPDAAAVPFGGCRFAGPRVASSDFTAEGFVWGGGIKWAATRNLLVGAEVLRLDSKDANFTHGPLAAWPAGQVPMTLDTTLAKITLEYRF